MRTGLRPVTRSNARITTPPRDDHSAGPAGRRVTRDTPVVTYCAAGARAARAASALAANGYTDVQALQSGYADWAAAGYPVERPDHDAAP